jgi:hypothetical protein
MSPISEINVVALTTTDKYRNITFIIDENADCFCFYAIANKIGHEYSVQLKNVLDKTYPERKDQVLYRDPISRSKGITSLENGNLSFSLPIVSPEENTDMKVGGAWSGEIKYEPSEIELDVTCIQRILQAKKMSKYTLKINLVLYTNNTGSALTTQKEWIKNELKIVEQVYKQASINCVFSDLTVEALPANEKITDIFRSTATSKVVIDNAKKEELTVIFVQDLEVMYTNEAGISGGLPGPQGFINDFAATLVKMTNGPNDALNINLTFLGLTIAHEIGHYLGLTHESAGEDKVNLMFPKLNALSKGTLTSKQTYILQHMPIVQIEYDDDLQTAITKLEVVITTGTRTLWFDDASTEMGISFKIGSDNGGHQNWSLDNGANDFQSGNTDVFTLTNPKNLYLENITTWDITCNWSSGMYFPLNFFMLEDTWDFAHIKITANDSILLADVTINQILSWAGAKRAISGKITNNK